MAIDMKKFKGLFDDDKNVDMEANIEVDLSDISSLENELKVIEIKNKIEISKLVHFENHPFKLYTGQRKAEMVESIRHHGVLTPIIVRKKGDIFEILSGHNRVEASKIVGIDEVPMILKEDITDEEAMLIVTETNLMQRSFTDLSYSERALIIATRHQAMKKQGVRKDLIEDIENTEINIDNMTSSEKLAEEYNLSNTNVKRYLKLAELNQFYLDLVDENILPFRVGVELAYLSKETLEVIESIISIQKIKIDLKKADLLRKAEKEGKATKVNIKKILTSEHKELKEPKSNDKIPKYLKPIITQYFKNNSEEEIAEIIQNALERYFNKDIEPNNN